MADAKTKAEQAAATTESARLVVSAADENVAKELARMAQLAEETKVANAAYLEAASREALARGAGDAADAETQAEVESASSNQAEAEQNAASLEVAASKAEAEAAVAEDAAEAARSTADIKKSEAAVAYAKLFEAEANLKLATAEEKAAESAATMNVEVAARRM